MIRKAILTLGMLAAAASVYAQSKQPCGTDEFYKFQKANNPKIAEAEATLTAEIQQYLKGRIANPRAKVTGADDDWPDDVNQMHIPVVVHIVEDPAGQNATYLSDKDIHEMVARLNAIFNGDPSLTTGIIPPFKAYIGNAHINFHLATKDPAGKPTRGIDRIYSYHSSGGDELAKLNGWAPDQYLNIWFENYVGRAGAALYATFPTSYADNPASQGVIGFAEYANPTNQPIRNSAVAHEIGHYLFLYHVWNSNNAAAGTRNAVCGDDEVDDTPPTVGHDVCNATATSLYDTLCAKDYHKDYDSATYSVMTGTDLPSVVTANESSNNAILFNDSLKNVIGQTFTTGSIPSFLESINLKAGTGTGNGGVTTVSLYNAAGTVRIARSEATPSAPAGALLKYVFKTGPYLGANTTYKVVVDTFGGRVVLPLALADNNPYAGGTMFKDSAAKTAVPGSDLYFVVNRLYRIDYPDTTNTQNIMDYSYCASQMFSKGQVARMRGALRSDVGYRSRISSYDNLLRTGVWDSSTNSEIPLPDLAPIADFTVNRPFICADPTNDAAILFTDRTYNDTADVSWTFNKGATIPASTLKSFNNKFSEWGWVTVSLTATSNTGTSTITRSDKVYAADPVAKDPNGYFQDFNPGGDLDRYPIFNYFNTDHRWELASNAGYYDKTSIRYKNYDPRIPNIANASGSPRGDYADFYTPAFDLLSLGSTANLTFYSAGAFRTNKIGEMNDKLEIAVSNDCGLTWRNIDTLTGGRIGNNGLRNEEFTPFWQGEWKQQSIPVTFKSNQTFFRFRYKAGVANPNLAPYGSPLNYQNFGTGNHFYLDRINITNAPLFVKNGVIVDLGMSVAPNPTSGSATVTLNGGDNSVAELSVTDVTGKLVYSKSINRASASTKVEIPASALTVKGMYLVKVVTNGATETQKLVVY